jgi:Acetyltransferase (GNAT) domain
MLLAPRAMRRYVRIARPLIENLAFYARRGYVEVARRSDDGFSRVFFAKPAPPPLRIETERLVLRPFQRGDLEPMHRVFSDPCVMRYTPGGARDHAGSADRLRSLIDHQHQHGFRKWALVTTSNAEVIGDCGLQYLDRGPEIELWTDWFASGSARDRSRQFRRGNGGLTGPAPENRGEPVPRPSSSRLAVTRRSYTATLVRSSGAFAAGQTEPGRCCQRTT